MRRSSVGLVLVSTLFTACASWPVSWSPSWPPSWPSFSRASKASLAKAERLTEEGHYQQAVAAYDEFLAEHADDSQAPRALANRDAIAGFLTARAELARLRQDLAARDAEVVRLREELTRVRQEGERLRADLERLKQIDLRQDRRR
jgi:chromosome segregation ATPase